MAEAKAKKKKKGGKLPIILVAVLVVAGGGFFAMSKGGGKEEEKKEPEIELGAVESLGDEFLVNLGDGRTFLSCQVAVQVIKAEDVHIADPSGDEKGGHGSGDASYNIARDAVIQVLSSKTADDIAKPDAMKYLRREIAAAINHAVHHEEPEEDTGKKKKKKKEEEADSHGDGHAEIDHEWLDEIGMDSEEGPVLKVFFSDFLWQKY